MNILLVQAYNGPEAVPVAPIGLGYMACALADAGHQVEVVDPNVGDPPFALLDERLAQHRYDAVGLSLRNVDDSIFGRLNYFFPYLRPLSERIRRAQPDAVQMIGGPGYSIFPEAILRKVPTLDFGVLQDGRESLLDLLSHLTAPRSVRGVYTRAGDQIVFGGPREAPSLDALGADPWRHLDMPRYVVHPISVGVVSKSGCVFDCAYCTYPHLSCGRLVLREPERVVDDLELVTRRYGAREVFFTDSIFNYPLQHATAVCAAIVRRGLALSWSAYFCEKFLTREFVELAVRAGCYKFVFSPDGIHGPTLKALAKIITEEDLYRSYRIVRAVPGARASYSFFLNPPGQNLAGVLKLARFYFLTRVLHRASFPECAVWYPRIYPDTALQKIAVEQGVLAPDADLLPETCPRPADLFYINPANRYLNGLFNGLVLPRRAVQDWMRRRRLGRRQPAYRAHHAKLSR